MMPMPGLYGRGSYVTCLGCPQLCVCVCVCVCGGGGGGGGAEIIGIFYGAHWQPLL